MTALVRASASTLHAPPGFVPAGRLLLSWALAAGLGAGCLPGVPELDESEWLPGGDATNTFTLGNLAYSQPYENADRDDEDAFYSGNSFFTSAWVQGVSSTSARDGLGPLFNARSCAACHLRDGRGRPPVGDEEVTGFLVRLSTGRTTTHGAPEAHAVYGGQLQNLAAGDVPAEGTVTIEYENQPFAYADGQRVVLKAPRYELAFTGYGDVDEPVAMSPRVAPAVIGLALLEAIPEAQLEQWADPDDEDGDGISGRVARVWSAEHGEMQVGRFGWKAEQPSVRDQNAGAFAGDMGLTSYVRPGDDCTSAQGPCLEAQSEDEPDVSDHVFNRVATYASLCAPPARETWSSEEILEGRRHFYEVGCTGCHVPQVTTGAHDISAAQDQRIWPYTDLLLHDMGDDLSDHRPTFSASGNEWRTPPLWGLSALPGVNGHMRLLHDGRADGVEEAILWHGGEARAARDNFAQLTAEQRARLVSFVESL